MSSSDTPKTILLKGDPISLEGAAAAASAIKPGMLVEQIAAGTYRAHASAGGNAAKIFAREADYVGGGIDDVYDVGENVVMWHCKPGDWIYAFLKAGQDVTIGTFLESAGDGSLRDTGTSGYAIAKAVEAVDNAPGVGGAAVRIKVEVV
jgi:hypothetical protein